MYLPWPEPLHLAGFWPTSTITLGLRLANLHPYGCGDVYSLTVKVPLATLPSLLSRLRRAKSLQSSSSILILECSIDGVLVRSSEPLPRAKKALSYLQKQRIPFILLTNGGGKHEAERVADLSERLEVPLDTRMFVQSHTPFATRVHGDGTTAGLKDKCILVVGGEGDRCRQVAERYGAQLLPPLPEGTLRTPKH